MELLVTGIVRSSHGVRGYMKVKSLSGEVAHFTTLDRVFLRKAKKTLEFEVETAALQKDTPLLKLKGIDTPEQVKKYSGWEICVAEENACPLGEGEYYNKDLLGLKLKYEGQSVATIVDVHEMPTSDMFEVQAADKTFMVPFKDGIIGDVRIADGYVELLDMEYLA